jgi:signal transduction histidine kinase
LIADLFELSRLDARELQLDRTLVALDSVIGKVIATYKDMAWERHRIVLEADLPDQLALVQADAQRVEQILVNLVTNGLRFTPAGGIVTIEAETLAEEIEVRVSDTGIGIPQEDLPYIFERFYRGDPSRGHDSDERLGSGSGLGLAIVKGLVEAMGGSVNATSPPDEGTCISFRLPLTADEH